MQDLRFEIEWQQPRGVNGAELSATWATLRIVAGDGAITHVLDTRTNNSREHLNVPVYPLAEWIATNWWFLNHEFLNPVKEGDSDFYRRHSLSSGRDGYAYPDLGVISSGERTNIFWKKRNSHWTSVKFIDEGSIWLDRIDFQETCTNLIETVIKRLDQVGVGDTLLHNEWRAIRSSDEEEAAFCAAAAGLGWDPYALDGTERDLVLMVSDRLGDFMDEAIPALEAERLDASTLAIGTAVEEAKHNRLALKSIQELKSEYSLATLYGRTPWEQGYNLAKRLRQVLDLSVEPLPDMSRIADALSEDVQGIESVMQPVDSLTQAPLIEALVTQDDEHSPAFAFRSFGENGKRFHFCRALAEVLTTSCYDSLITRARSERQQRNRAFAAEFLAPSAALANMVSYSVVDDNNIEEMAEGFGVSTKVIEHQIVNNRIARISRE